jgi:trimethylamine--corrinoid protein Co-methyltransferase
VPVDEEVLALDVIDELGPTGDYLSHDHTMRHFLRPYYSRLADKGTYSQWAERGSTTMEERAAEEVDRILRSHKPEALPAGIQKEIRGIVEREQAWIEGQR